MLAIDISKFGSKEKFKADVNEYIDFIKNSKKKEDVKEIFIPGEIEYNRLKINMENGIELKDNVYYYLEKITREYNIINKEQSLQELAYEDCNLGIN